MDLRLSPQNSRVALKGHGVKDAWHRSIRRLSVDFSTYIAFMSTLYVIMYYLILYYILGFFIFVAMKWGGRRDFSGNKFFSFLVGAVLWQRFAFL